MEYDSIIVLSHHLNQDGTLSGESRERVERGVLLFNEGRARTILMSGGYATKGVNVSHANAMRNEAIRINVFPERIRTEEKSLDTAGQAIYTKTDVVAPESWRRLIVVSHDYHIRRVGEIFDFIYGNGFEIDYDAVHSDKLNRASVKEQEAHALALFQNMIRGIERGEHAKVLERLLKEHPSYQ